MIMLQQYKHDCNAKIIQIWHTDTYVDCYINIKDVNVFVVIENE